VPRSDALVDFGTKAVGMLQQRVVELTPIDVVGVVEIDPFLLAFGETDGRLGLGVNETFSESFPVVAVRVRTASGCPGGAVLPQELPLFHDRQKV
jgi:hypothetical protein